MSRSGSTITMSTAETHKVTGITFGILRPDEIEAMSCAQISHTDIYDEEGRPRDGGINDLHMGTNDNMLLCKTCNGKKNDCPGHFGHIKLARPVYHIGFLNELRRILRSVCFKCSRLLADQNDPKFKEAISIRSPKARGKRLYKICEGIKRCTAGAANKGDDDIEGSEFGPCGTIQPKIVKDGIGLTVEFAEPIDNSPDRKRKLSAEEALGILKKISDIDCEALGFDPARSRPD